MTVFLGYVCYFDGCNEYDTVEKVFDCEVKALSWKEEVEATDREWREYRSITVE